MDFELTINVADHVQNTSKADEVGLLHPQQPLTLALPPQSSYIGAPRSSCVDLSPSDSNSASAGPENRNDWFAHRPIQITPDGRNPEAGR